MVPIEFSGKAFRRQLATCSQTRWRGLFGGGDLGDISTEMVPKAMNKSMGARGEGVVESQKMLPCRQPCFPRAQTLKQQVAAVSAGVRTRVL